MDQNIKEFINRCSALFWSQHTKQLFNAQLHSPAAPWHHSCDLQRKSLQLP